MHDTYPWHVQCFKVQRQSCRYLFIAAMHCGTPTQYMMNQQEQSEQNPDRDTDHLPPASFPAWPWQQPSADGNPVSEPSIYTSNVCMFSV